MAESKLAPWRFEIAGLFALVFLTAGFAAWAAPAPDDGPVPPTAPAPPPNGLWTTPDAVPRVGIAADAPLSMSSFADLARAVRPTVVNISVTQRVVVPTSRRDRFLFPFMPGQPEGYENRGLGSGFVISAEGYILTNFHVVDGADTITVRFDDGTRLAAELIGADPPTDVALLKVTPEKPLAAAPLGDSDALDVGEWVLAIGNPFGLGHTVTAGIVSAKGRKDVTPDGRRMVANFIQTDASINPGNSGGPLFNTRAEVVGMNTAINAAGQGIGFAIPANMLKTLLPHLKAHGRLERSWLGVQIRDVTDEHAEALGLTTAKGAILVEVVPGSPAEAGGLRAGDVVVGFDGHPVESPADLQWFASTAGAGHAAALDIVREGKTERLSVTLQALPEPAELVRKAPRASAPTAEQAIVPGVGLSVAELTDADRRRLRVVRPGGVRVVAVDPAGRAAQVGLEVDDVILVVGRERIRNVRDFEGAMKRVRPGQIVPLVVFHQGQTRFVEFRRGK